MKCRVVFISYGFLKGNIGYRSLVNCGEAGIDAGSSKLEAGTPNK
jgi:hypothetical protein